MHAPTRLFFLDDDPQRLVSWESALSGWKEDWDLQFFRFRKDLNAAIEAEEPTVVITRHGLRRSPGIRVLESIEKKHPGVRLVLLASKKERMSLQARVDDRIALLSVSDSANDLRAELKRILAIEAWLGNERLAQVLAKSGSIPSLPSVYLEVMDLLNSENGSLEDVSQRVSRDPAISAKLLKVVNSAYSGFSEKVSDISQAVMMLGTESVRNLVLAIQVFGNEDEKGAEAEELEKLWNHSLEVADVAKRIVMHETGDRKAAEEAYTAGLFHDMGKLVLRKAASDDFAEANRLAAETGRLSWVLEEQLMGCHHAEAGAYLLGVWRMPLPLIETVAFHHQPHQSLSQGFTALTAVHAANALVRARLEGIEMVRQRLDEDYIAAVGCEASFLQWIDLIVGEGVESGMPVAGEAPEVEAHSTAVVGSEEAEPPDRKVESAEPVSSADPAVSEVETCKVVSDEATGDAATSERQPRRFGFLPLSALGWAAACLVVVLMLAWVLRPRSKPAESSTTAFLHQFETSAPNADFLESSAQEMEAIIAEFPDEAVAVELPPEAERTPDPVAIPLVISEPPPIVASVETVSKRPPPPSVKVETIPAFKLSGIYFRASNPMAVINGRKLKVGDEIEGAHIERITRSSVELSWRGEHHILKLK